MRRRDVWSASGRNHALGSCPNPSLTRRKTCQWAHTHAPTKGSGSDLATVEITRWQWLRFGDGGWEKMGGAGASKCGEGARLTSPDSQNFHVPPCDSTLLTGPPLLPTFCLFLPCCAPSFSLTSNRIRPPAACKQTALLPTADELVSTSYVKVTV
ncbi:uncharacterized protein BKA78DRAFT_98874 [Phyllosticta capitalensis]|uniref:uncharacterized protein n=1 Tax=Phyllosticta capitalensis TaxID=121624 RepID=UPI0031323CE1